MRDRSLVDKLQHLTNNTTEQKKVLYAIALYYIRLESVASMSENLSPSVISALI